MNWIKDISLFIASILISLLLCELILSIVNPINLRSDPKWVPDGHTRGHYVPNEIIRGSVGHNIRNPNLRQNYARYSLNKYGYRGLIGTFRIQTASLFTEVRLHSVFMMTTKMHGHLLQLNV